MSLVKYNNQLISLSKISIWCVGALGLALGPTLDIERWSKAILLTSIPIQLANSKSSKFSSDWCVKILAMQRPLAIACLSFMLLMLSVINHLFEDDRFLGDSHNEKVFFFFFHFSQTPILLSKNVKKGVCFVSNWQEFSTSLIVVACKLLWYWCNAKKLK